MRCLLALSMGWLVLKGYWNAHTKRLTIKFFHAHHAIKIENYGRAVIASPDTYICIRTTSFLQTEVL